MTTSSPIKPAQRRVAAYLRVSTGRQAEAELSLPDQLRQAEAFCAARGWELREVFQDAGASGTDEDRPEFQRMIATATAADRPFDVVLVHSTSRFARDVFHAELYLRRLRSAKVDLVSMTQDISGGDGTSEMVRQMLAVFDQFQSRENAKHTHRAMRENARQGFWNGSRAPFGYRTAEAGRRGHRIKKVLVVDEAEAALVRRIFALHLGAEGLVLGVKAIAAQLNQEGQSFRGKRFSISNVHRILTAETYAGCHWFDRVNARSQERKPRDQWVAMSVPPIVSRDDFERVQESLASRAPRNAPPRAIGSPVLLTGIAACATCGGGMTLRTGKSGRYRYYTCASSAHRGKAVCAGRTVPMDQLDRVVIGAFADRILQPERLQALLSAYVARSVEADAGRRERVARLKKALTEASGMKTRLLKLVASGTLDPDDPDLAGQLMDADARRKRAEEEIALVEAQAGAAGPQAITPAKLARLAAAIRIALDAGPPEFRRAYLRLFVGKVTVGDQEIRIAGSTATLARAAADGPEETLENDGSHFHRVWRPLGETTKRS